jgi:hypothetical protein
MSRRQFVALLTALYDHEFPNWKFEDDTALAECVARVENGFICAPNQIRSMGNYDTVAQFLCTLSVERNMYFWKLAWFCV